MFPLNPDLALELAKARHEQFLREARQERLIREALAGQAQGNPRPGGKRLAVGLAGITLIALILARALIV